MCDLCIIYIFHFFKYFIKGNILNGKGLLDYFYSFYKNAENVSKLLISKYYFMNNWKSIYFQNCLVMYIIFEILILCALYNFWKIVKRHDADVFMQYSSRLIVSTRKYIYYFNFNEYECDN